MVHRKCRTLLYPFGNIRRMLLTDEQVPWNVNFSYDPPEYESPLLVNKPWADPKLDKQDFNPQFNAVDGKVNRVSYTGNYSVENKRPLNPEGRTGLKGRGVLGRWGPNHAADPIVTRWKCVGNIIQYHPISNLPILQFCGIQRRDCDEWAIPGGMVDCGEIVSDTLKREFLEEAFNNLESDEGNSKKNGKLISNFFKAGQEIYKGYVDDPRNTDNAWMETVAMNFHDETGEFVGKFKLKAGDDAKNVQWIDIDKDLQLYASHTSFIEKISKLRNCHW